MAGYRSHVHLRARRGGPVDVGEAREDVAFATGERVRDVHELPIHHDLHS
jgi:hypothetical protein